MAINIFIFSFIEIRLQNNVIMNLVMSTLPLILKRDRTFFSVLNPSKFALRIIRLCLHIHFQECIFKYSIWREKQSFNFHVCKYRIF